MTHQVFISSAVPVTSEKTFAEAADSYLKHGGDGKHIQPIIDHFGNRPLASIFPFDVKEMAAALYPTQSNATRNRQALTPARAVINHGYERGWCSLIRIRKLKEDPPRRKTPASPVLMHSFIRQCAKDGLPHVAAIVLFMSQTAARISEPINVRWKDVDLAGRRALLVKTKTRAKSIRHLTDEVVRRLHELQGNAAAEDRVFDTRTVIRSTSEYMPSAAGRRSAISRATCAADIRLRQTRSTWGWTSRRRWMRETGKALKCSSAHMCIPARTLAVRLRIASMRCNLRK